MNPAAEIGVLAWSAFGLGLHSQQEWREWASDPRLRPDAANPDLGDMPMLLRRRLSHLGRAVAVVAQSIHTGYPGLPMIFGSRYGDAERALALLGELSESGDVSPSGFSMSVHNGIGATYSIAKGEYANYLSVAGGAATSAACVIEAAALLADGAPVVGIVCYDAPLPEDYACFHDEPQVLHAWAWRVVRPSEADVRIRVSATRTPAAPPRFAARLPYGLDVLRFFLSADESLHRQAGNMAWTWTRDVAR